MTETANFRISGLGLPSVFWFRVSPHGTSTPEIRLKTRLMPENVRNPPLSLWDIFKILRPKNGVSGQKTRMVRSVWKIDARFVPENARFCPKIPDRFGLPNPTKGSNRRAKRRIHLFGT
jgi:hypothetical protein